MATVYELLKDPTIGLIPYLNTQFSQDFENMRVRPFGFTAPGLLDPEKDSQGYILKGMINVNNDPDNQPSTVPVLVGKIMPMANPLDDSRQEAYELGHRIAAAILEWSRCVAPGLQEWVSVNFELKRDQTRNVASTRSAAWYHVMLFQFDLVGWFDVP